MNKSKVWCKTQRSLGSGNSRKRYDLFVFGLGRNVYIILLIKKKIFAERIISDDDGIATLQCEKMSKRCT